VNVSARGVRRLVDDVCRRKRQYRWRVVGERLQRGDRGGIVIAGSGRRGDSRAAVSAWVVKPIVLMARAVALASNARNEGSSSPECLPLRTFGAVERRAVDRVGQLRESDASDVLILRCWRPDWSLR